MAEVALLALGGTVSMAQDANEAVPALGAGQIAAWDRRITEAVDVARVGGSEVAGSHLVDLAEHLRAQFRAGAVGAVVTCGTDAIEEVAAWLAWTGPWPAPVAVTGSMLPGSRPDSDGRANVSDAVTTVLAAPVTEPLVVFAGEVLLGREAVKMSGSVRTAFAAPGRGGIGAVTPLGAVFWRLPAATSGLGVPPRAPIPVPVVLAALGDDGQLLALAGEHPAGVVVVAANGAGNLPPQMAACATALLDKGVAVVIASRSPDALTSPVYGYPGGSSQLASYGAVFVPGLTPHRARIIAGIALAHRHDVAAVLRRAADDLVEGAPQRAGPTS